MGSGWTNVLAGSSWMALRDGELQPKLQSWQ